jgi:hypothetical protein
MYANALLQVDHAQNVLTVPVEALASNIPTIRVTSSLVVLDMTVLDKKGNPTSC